MSSPHGPQWRRVQVPRERVGPWLDGFAARHGDVRYDQPRDDRPRPDHPRPDHPRPDHAREAVRVMAEDGAVALITPVLSGAEPGAQPATLLRQLERNRTIGLVLARKGGHAVGLLREGRLVSHACGRGYVQGRTKAGGWSQQRYARRRAGQARAAYAKAADDVARLLADADVQAVACAGDRAAVTAVWSDPRLAALAERWNGQLHPCAEPRLRVLEDFVTVVLGVTVELNAAAQA